MLDFGAAGAHTHTRESLSLSLSLCLFVSLVHSCFRLPVLRFDRVMHEEKNNSDQIQYGNGQSVGSPSLSLSGSFILAHLFSFSLIRKPICVAALLSHRHSVVALVRTSLLFSLLPFRFSLFARIISLLSPNKRDPVVRMSSAGPFLVENRYDDTILCNTKECFSTRSVGAID